MGYGMPAAFAAKLVHPERAVVCVVGDGGFQMTAGELSLARRLEFGRAADHAQRRLARPDESQTGTEKLSAFRRSLGAPPESPRALFRCSLPAGENIDEFSAALDWAFAIDGPTVIEAFIDAGAYSATVFD